MKTSYSAAYTVQLREAEIRMLHEQVTALDQTLANAQAQERADAEAQARAHAEALDRARAEAQALADAQAQARAHAEAVARANEEARQRAQAEAEARQIAAANAAAAAAQQAIRAANTYKVQLPLKAAAPVFVMATGAVAVLETGITLTSAISSAVLALGAVSLEALAVGVAALLYAPKLGNGELQENYLLSMPLTDLTVDLDGPAQAAAIAHGSLDLPLRMGAKQEAVDHTDLFVARTSGPDMSSKVRVLPAQFDASNNRYTVSTQDTPSRTMVWTPAVTPPDGSTTLPASPSSATTFVGPVLEPIEGRLDTFPDLPDVGFDDYVIIFPADSGLPPLYVMFKSPRHMSGMVAGQGEVIHGTLFGEGNAQGAAIPAQIASELRGKEFSSFGAFRRALWKAISHNPTLAEQFDLGTLMSMRRGLAPIAPDSEQVGGRIKYEIHHKIRIADGGGVYDLDNMIILSPKSHILMHKNGGNDE